MFINFVTISLSLSLLIGLLATFLQARRARGHDAPFHMPHRFHRHTSRELQEEALQGRAKILRVEAFHVGPRGRYVLACVAPAALIEAHEQGGARHEHEEIAWDTRICLELLARTEAHVVVLEVHDTNLNLRWRKLVTSDRLGWTGDRFDRVEMATWRPEARGDLTRS